jgi:prepilin-type N-terminal cleavage/methylation domain-containing protein
VSERTPAVAERAAHRRPASEARSEPTRGLASREANEVVRRGFTLLEVLAAVAVLGFTVTMLARGAIQGMRYEGDASRRLAASLIADRALFEVESALAQGTLPEVGHKESEEGGDEFRLSLDVAPLDPAALGIAALFTGPPSEAGAAPPAALAAAPQLLLVTVQVAWTEGLTEQAVTRTSFAYDASAAAQALGAAEGAAAGTPNAGAEAPAEEEQEEEP